METRYRRIKHVPGPDLETFLSGMETGREREACPEAEVALETFLSGMETRRPLAFHSDMVALETFLSGMETKHNPLPATSAAALKPSLVEWKLLFLRLRAFCRCGLETFLSGMETQAKPRLALPRHGP